MSERPSLLFDLLSTQPTGLATRHGGGVYGQRFLNELLARNFFSVSGLDLGVAYDSRRFIPAELLQAISAAEATLIDVGSFSELVSVVRSVQWPVMYTPVANWLGDFPDLARQTTTRIHGTVHQLRPLDAPGDPYEPLLEPRPLRRLRRRLRNWPRSRAQSRNFRHISAMMSNLSMPILSVSQHSKWQIITEFPEVHPEDVFVVDSIVPEPPATNAQTAGEKEGSSSRLPVSVPQAEPYLLVLNSNRPIKNLPRVLHACERYKPAVLNSIRIVAVGLSERHRAFLKRRFPWAVERLVAVPHLDDQEYQATMAGALGLLYPSLSEGFGYPPLEAMSHGVPVLASAVTSIPEIAGRACLYFNPYSLGEIASRLNRFVEDQALRRELVAAGTSVYREFLKRRPDTIDAFGRYLLRITPPTTGTPEGASNP